MQSITFGSVPTYAALIAAYPANGAALAALPSGARVYVENMATDVMRSSDGKYWIPARPVTAPRFTGSNAHWIGPHIGSTISSSAGQTRKIVRPVYYRMPGFQQATVARISIYQGTNGTVGAGTDSFQLRLYEANPDGSPIVGAAPLFTWDWNVGGTGGAGTLSLASAGANATRLHADIPGGAKVVPPHFWLGFLHDFATTAPAVSTVGTTSIGFDVGPAELSGTDLTNVLSITRSSSYTWDETASAWAIGNAAVWPAAEYTSAGSASVCVHLKITG